VAKLTSKTWTTLMGDSGNPEIDRACRLDKLCSWSPLANATTEEFCVAVCVVTVSSLPGILGVAEYHSVDKLLGHLADIKGRFAHSVSFGISLCKVGP
jgi:hypothetical protein